MPPAPAPTPAIPPTLAEINKIRFEAARQEIIDARQDDPVPQPVELMKVRKFVIEGETTPERVLDWLRAAGLSGELSAKTQIVLSVVTPRDAGHGVDLIQRMIPGLKVQFKSEKDLPPKIPEGVQLFYWIDKNSSEMHRCGRRVEYSISVSFATAKMLADKKGSRTEYEIIDQILVQHKLESGNSCGNEFWYEDSPKELRDKFKKAGFIARREVLNVS